PGDGTTPFMLQSGTIVTLQNPAYVHLQAACTSPYIPNVNSLPGRPYPGLGRIFSLQNVAGSRYDALQFTLRRTRGPLTAGLSYSYSHSLDNSSDRSDPVLVDSYNLRSNWASSNFDERHLLSLSYLYQVPNLARGMRDLFADMPADVESGKPGADADKCCSKLLEWMFNGWEISGVTSFQSATPFTVINSAGDTGIALTDNAGVSSGLGIAASYPDVVRGLKIPSNSYPSFGPMLGNAAEFVAPRGLTFGDAGRNFLNNPSRLNFDLTL